MGGGEVPRKLRGRQVIIFCKANPDFAVGERDGKVVMMNIDSQDWCQLWYKDDSLGEMMKDDQGNPAFVLVNKASGRALRSAFGAGQELLVTKYSREFIDTSVMWSRGPELEKGNIYRTLLLAKPGTGLTADVQHGEIFDGSKVITWYPNGNDNQLWSISNV